MSYTFLALERGVLRVRFGLPMGSGPGRRIDSVKMFTPLIRQNEGLDSDGVRLQLGITLCK